MALSLTAKSTLLPGKRLNLNKLTYNIEDVSLTTKSNLLLENIQILTKSLTTLKILRLTTKSILLP